MGKKCDKYVTGAAFEVKGADPNAQRSAGDPIMRISGYASTKEVDSYNEIVEPSAFAMTMGEFMKFPILLFGHDWYSKPIGKIVDYKIDDTGLFVDAEISNTADGVDIAELISANILKAFSIGFWPLLVEDGEKEGDPRIIKKLKLGEISIINVPANEGALFDQAKAMQLNLKSITTPFDGEGRTRKGSTMENAEKAKEITDLIEEKVGGFKTSLDTFSTDVGNLKKNQDENARLLKHVQEQQEKLAKGVITPEEMATFSQKIGADILDLAKKIDRANAAIRINAEKESFPLHKYDIRSLLVMRDDQGVPLSPNQQKEYALLRMPVRYDTPDGRMLQALRNINDVCLCIDACHRGQNKNYSQAKLKSFSLMKELLEIVDPEFAKAMYSTGTGLGDEWVPTGWSSELYDLYRIEATLEGVIPSFEMPNNPYIWPLKSSNSTMYVAGEAVTNNPSVLTKSNVGTSNTTFTAVKYAVAIPASPELIEDSIVAIVPTLRADMAESMAHGYESVLINGDVRGSATLSTHQDHGSASTRWPAGSPELYEDGLRRLAIADSKTFDVASASAGVGDGTTAFVADDMRYLRKLCGKLGVNQRNFVYLVPVCAWFKMLGFTPITQAATYMMQAGSWATGTLPPFDGCQVVVTEHIDETQHTTGLYTTGSTYTSVIGFNRTCFKVGNRGPISLEFEKDIQTQQWTFVSCMRKCFKKCSASTTSPVAMGIDLAA